MPPSSPSTLPLDGVRVVDLTTIVMGPLATRMLADQGADVIRVEEPGGDVIRGYEPMRSPRMSAMSMNLNRNKRSVELDLKTEPGARALRDLLATADVFVTNLRRRALDRLGLDEESVRAIRPDVVYAVANGWGSGGPHADRAAFDDVIQAASGLSSVFEWTVGEPQLVPSIYADKVSATHLAFAIASALHGRSRTGEGVTIEVPMAETMAAFNLVEHLGGQTFDPTEGDFSYARIRTPHRRPRRAADGWVVILPYSDRNWADFWAYVDRPDLAADPRFATNRDRVANADTLYGLLDELVATRSIADWVAFCDEHSIPIAPVVPLAEVIDDDHFRAVELVRHDEHPTEGPYRYVRDPIVVDGERRSVRRHAPRLGADTVEVLTELGWTDADLADLRPS